VEISLIPLDILDHKVFAGELYVVGEMIDKLVVTCKIQSFKVAACFHNFLHLPKRVPLSGEKSARTL
jgi:hypothetical protein